MSRVRWIVPWKDSVVKPVFYHCISRVVDRKLVFGPAEKEKFRTFMRMQERFTGCRVVSYCLMCNHFHLLLEVPPSPAGGLSDEILLERLSAIYGEAFVADVANELAEARDKVRNGLAEESLVVARIHDRFTYRMHDLSEFMKTLVQRFTQWFNRTHRRAGNLWEDAFKSVIVEDGVAAKAIAAYIDLNPVRAGMVKNPEDYRWSSYGEAICGGPRGNGKRARAGLVRALRAHNGMTAEAAGWSGDVDLEYRRILLAGAGETALERVNAGEKIEKLKSRKGLSAEQLAAEDRRLLEAEEKRMGEIPFGRMLRCRVRYFTDGAVIGSRQFVNEVFENSRHRFGPKRRDGARKLRGDASAAAGMLWSMRDLSNPEPAD